MTAPTPPNAQPEAPERGRALLRVAVWVAIGALIAAAIVCVVWVLLGPDNGLIGRAFLTILLLAGFAGVAILDAHLAPRRPAWFALLSMVVWVVILLDGAFLIWMDDGYADYYFTGLPRFLSFLFIVLILQLALLHVRLYTKAHARYVTPFTRTIVIVTLVLVGVLAVLLVVPLTFHPWVDFLDFYWRVVVALTILAAVGTALIPLMNALFAPKPPRPAAALPPWPTYGDGVTPLPVLPDGSPDWNAYYTGYPSYPQQPGSFAGAPTPQHPGSPQPAAAPTPPAAAPTPTPPAAAPTPTPPVAAPAPPAPAPPAPAPAPAPPAAAPGYEGYPPPPAPPQ